MKRKHNHYLGDPRVITWAGLTARDASTYLFFSYEPPPPNMQNQVNIQHVVARTRTSNGPQRKYRLLMVLASGGLTGGVASDGRSGWGKSTSPGLPPGCENHSYMATLTKVLTRRAAGIFMFSRGSFCLVGAHCIFQLLPCPRGCQCCRAHPAAARRS